MMEKGRLIGGDSEHSYFTRSDTSHIEENQ